MSPAYIFTTNNQVNIMALKTKDNEETTFEDLEWEAEYEEEYTTISGKEQAYEPEWEKMSVHDLDVGLEFDGTPEVTIFEKPEKSYNAMRLRLLDDGEILDCYFNYPKKDYPYVKGINKDFDFYKPCFDFIFHILKFRNERNVVDPNGEEINRFKQVNLETFAKYVDQMTKVRVKITEGDNGYNNWIITFME